MHQSRRGQDQSLESRRHATCWSESPEFSTHQLLCGGVPTFPPLTKASGCSALHWDTQITWPGIYKGWIKSSKLSWTESHPCVTCNRHGSCCCTVLPHVPTSSCAWCILWLLRDLPKNTMRGCGSVSRASCTSIEPNAKRQSEMQQACHNSLEFAQCDSVTSSFVLGELVRLSPNDPSSESGCRCCSEAASKA